MPQDEPRATGGPGAAHVDFQAASLDSEHARPLLAMAEAADPRAAALRSDEAEDFAVDNDGAFLVAYVNGQPAGCGGFRVLPGDPSGDTVEIALMYVRPGSRRTGLARAILRQLERWAAHDGFRYAVLWVSAEQPSAQALVEVTGYRREPGQDGGRSGHGYGKSLRRPQDCDVGSGSEAEASRT